MEIKRVTSNVLLQGPTLISQGLLIRICIRESQRVAPIDAK